MDKVELSKRLGNWSAWSDYDEDYDDNNEQGWKWYGRLRVSSSPSLTDADIVYHDWWRSILRPGASISRCPVSEKGKAHFYVFRSDVDFVSVREHGSFEGHVRFYALLGTGDKVWSKSYAKSQWLKVGGSQAFLYSYRSKEAFAAYVLKHAHADSDFSVIGVDYGFSWFL